MQNIRIEKAGLLKLALPGNMLKLDGEFPIGPHGPLISKEACLAAGLIPQQVQAEFKAGKRTVRNAADATLCLKLGMNPDGNEVLTQDVSDARGAARYLAAKCEKFAAQLAQAKACGQPVKISSESWMETRSAREGGVMGDYQFACSRTEWAMPNGEFKVDSSAVNCY